MIISISEAAKRFQISRSKLYRMQDTGKISFTKDFSGKIGVDLSELFRVFGETNHKHGVATKSNEQNHLATENFYLKREVEILTHNLQKSEARVDQFMALTQEQAKQILLTQSPSKSFWHRLWRK